MKKIACPKKKNFSHYLVLFFCFLFLIIPSISQASEHSTSDPYYNKIQKRGKLIIGLSADYAPYEFHTTVKGKDTIVGFDVSIAQKIAKDLGVKLQIEELGFDALLGALKTGKIDLIISGMSPTPERLKEVDFTTPYMTIRQRIVVRRADQAKFRSPNDFQGVKVAAQKQTIQEKLAKNELIGAKVTSLQRIPEIMMCLTNKKVDAVVLEEPVADAYLQKQPDLAYANVPLQADKKETAIALPKQAPVLKQKINATLSTIKEKHLLKDYQQKANEQMFQKESFLKKYSPYFLNGALYTIFLAIIGVFFGALIGGILALGKRSTNRLWKGLASIYIEYVRGTPLLVQIFLVYFGTAALGLDLNKLVAGCIALSLNSGAYVAEIVRAGINGVAKGQMEAARSLGMNPRQAMRHVIFPQAIKNILPALGNEFVTVIKESSVISVIGVSELMFQAGNVQGASFKPFLPYLIVSLIYFVLTFTLSKCLGVAERRMKTSD